jgi:hypothetical protein
VCEGDQRLRLRLRLHGRRATGGQRNERGAWPEAACGRGGCELVSRCEEQLLVACLRAKRVNGARVGGEGFSAQRARSQAIS